MAKNFGLRLSVLIFLIYYLNGGCAKITDNKTSDSSAEVKPTRKMTDGAALLFADEFKQTFEKYLFGICPQTYKVTAAKAKNLTVSACDLDDDQQDLAGRLATLALRAHSASRTECSRLATSLINVLGDLARTASTRQVAAANEANKKRKLSKSQKLKIQAKQRTALAVKKKAAAVAAAAAAKMST